MEPDDPSLDPLIGRAGAAFAPIPTEEPLDDGLVLAWLAGRLAPEAAEALEARLARDPEARALAFALREGVPAPTQSRAVAALGSRPTLRPWLLAAAAAVVLGVGLWAALRSPPPEPGPAWTAGPLQGSVKRMMAGEAPETGIFLPQSELRVVLRPDVPGATAPIQVFADRGDAVVRVPATLEAGEAGIVRLRVVAEVAFGRAFGARRLRVAVGPWPGPVPERLTEAPPGGLTWLDFPVDYRPTAEESR